MFTIHYEMGLWHVERNGSVYASTPSIATAQRIADRLNTNESGEGI